MNGGDATASQTAMQKLQSDMASVRGRGGHHHHHGGGAAPASSTDSSAATGITAAGQTGATSGVDADGDHDVD